MSKALVKIVCCGRITSKSSPKSSDLLGEILLSLLQGDNVLPVDTISCLQTGELLIMSLFSLIEDIHFITDLDFIPLHVGDILTHGVIYCDIHIASTTSSSLDLLSENIDFLLLLLISYIMLLSLIFNLSFESFETDNIVSERCNCLLQA